MISMLVKDLMTKNVITCSADDKINNALSKMLKYRIHQLPVLYRKELKGILTINKIVTREIDPTTTNVSTLMVSSPKMSPENTVDEAIELILNSNLRAIPVFDSELHGIISESDLLKAIKLDGLASNISKESTYVSKNDNIGKIKDLMVHRNISRVSVVEKGNAVGIIGNLDLVKTVSKNRYEARGKTSSYKDIHRMHSDKTSVETIMQEPKIINPDLNLSDVIALLQNNDALLIGNDKIGIITPKDILRMTLKPKKHEYIHITGLRDEPATIREKIYQAASELLKGFSSLELQPMKIIIEYYSPKGREKYSVHIQLPTNIGIFVSTKAHGWDLVSVVQKALNNLEKEIRKKYERVKERSKHRETLKKR